MKHMAVAITGLIISCWASAEPPNDDDPTVVYVQAWIGAVDMNESWTVTDPTSEVDVVGDLGTVPYGGGAAQQLWGDGALRFGYEGGGLVSWRNDDTEFFGSSGGNGGTLIVTTDNTFFSVGVFMGAVVSAHVTPGLRLLAAAGPSLTWARLDGDDHELMPQPLDAVIVATDDGRHDVSFVAYARAGLEVVLPNGFTLGVSVRHADDEFDFGSRGEVEVDEVLWLLTLGARL